MVHQPSSLLDILLSCLVSISVPLLPLQIERIHNEAENESRLLKDRITRSEETRIELEEEIGRLKIAATEERLRAEEHVMHMKQKVKADEVVTLLQYYVKDTFKDVLKIDFVFRRRGCMHWRKKCECCRQTETR